MGIIKRNLLAVKNGILIDMPPNKLIKWFEQQRTKTLDQEYVLRSIEMEKKVEDLVEDLDRLSINSTNDDIEDPNDLSLPLDLEEYTTTSTNYYPLENDSQEHQPSNILIPNIPYPKSILKKPYSSSNGSRKRRYNEPKVGSQRRVSFAEVFDIFYIPQNKKNQFTRLKKVGKNNSRTT